MDKDQEGVILSAETLHSMNIGDPDKLIDFTHLNTDTKTLDETKKELHQALTTTASMINDDFNGAGHYNAIDFSRLSSINTAILHGINYLEHVENMINAIKIIRNSE